MPAVPTEPLAGCGETCGIADGCQLQLGASGDRVLASGNSAAAERSDVYVHVVALAVADGVQAVVEEVVLARETVDRVRAPVVLLAAAVRRQHVAVRAAVRRRHVARAAPARARHYQTHAPATSTRWPLVAMLLVIRDRRQRFVYARDVSDVKAAFHDTDILARILADSPDTPTSLRGCIGVSGESARIHARMSMSWNAALMKITCTYMHTMRSTILHGEC